MPSLSTGRIAWVFERMILQSIRRQAHARAPREQPRPVRGDEMGEASAEPEMSMQPETAVHRVDHPIASRAELLPVE